LSEKLETVLTADGQVQTELAAGDVVTIRRSNTKSDYCTQPTARFSKRCEETELERVEHLTDLLTIPALLHDQTALS
jgi:NAD kinase